MAAQLGVAPSTLMRHWQANGLKPHVVRGFKVSRDPKFVEKLEDIVGLYMSPPEHALVMCCDEKSEVQALDRMQPGLSVPSATDWWRCTAARCAPSAPAPGAAALSRS